MTPKPSLLGGNSCVGQRAPYPGWSFEFPKARFVPSRRVALVAKALVPRGPSQARANGVVPSMSNATDEDGGVGTCGCSRRDQSRPIRVLVLPSPIPRQVPRNKDDFPGRPRGTGFPKRRRT